MDDPALEEEEHFRALQGLRRINTTSDAAGMLWRYIEQHPEIEQRPLRILDLGSGGGDVLLALFRRSIEAKVRIRLTASDFNQRTVDYLRKQIDSDDFMLMCREAATDFVPIETRVLDVFSDPIPTDCDVVMCSLFLHHLERASAVRLLASMGKATRKLVLVNDLHRSRFAWWTAYLGTRLLTRSRVVHHDGVRSVEAAFTPEEALELADEAGLPGATVERRWPCRWVLQWWKS